MRPHNPNSENRTLGDAVRPEYSRSKGLDAVGGIAQRHVYRRKRPHHGQFRGDASFVAGNAAMFEQIRAVELRQLEYQKTTDKRFELVFDHMETRGAPRQEVFFEDQVYDAFELLTLLVKQRNEARQITEQCSSLLL